MRLCGWLRRRLGKDRLRGKGPTTGFGFLLLYRARSLTFSASVFEPLSVGAAEGGAGLLGDQSGVFDQEAGTLGEPASIPGSGDDTSSATEHNGDPIEGHLGGSATATSSELDTVAAGTDERPPDESPSELTPDTEAASAEILLTPPELPDVRKSDDRQDQTPHEWVKPGRFTTEAVPDGLYKGREVVGSAGSLLSVPALPPRIAGLDRHSDLEADVHTVGALKLAAGSLRGASHYESAEVRQDAYAIGSSRNEDWLIIALADGVSSGKFSHLAAITACLHGMAGTRDLLPVSRSTIDSTGMLQSLDWTKLSEDIRGAILAQARKILGGAIKDADGQPADLEAVPPETYARAMSTTFEVTVIACHPDAEDRHPFARVVFAGDGSGYILDPGRGWKVLSLGKSLNPHIASNSVVPLPIDPGPPLITTGHISPGQALLMTTDGIGDFLADGSTALGGYLHSRWSTPQGLNEYINTLSFVTRQADDDRTAVVVWT